MCLMTAYTKSRGVFDAVLSTHIHPNTGPHSDELTCESVFGVERVVRVRGWRVYARAFFLQSVCVT